ncbi:hypothetical protein HK105_203641 [Polyrhizophydium stewartii]|uniref:Flavin reductase like domain-containing protein n=1 Tax=Polyrhizophydium stewartii TaxID=2732419 RepID=A0ABR4NBL3_9FUNG|nr:hypothetical protein HK105_007582 [Polyrhizophydium stewartii]
MQAAAKRGILARGVSTKALGDSLRSVMRKVPQPVVVVTVATPDEARGMTCSSFTSVSLSPPIVSFAVRYPSSTSQLLSSSSLFAVHLLARQQVAHSVAFSSPKTQADFTRFSHHLDESGTGLPILHGSLGVLICRPESRVQAGDHEVWYGRVERMVHGLGSTRGDPKMEPLLYYESSYRSIGDEVFLDAFERGTLSFSEWTHRAHVRMAWLYITEAKGDLDEAVPRVKEGISRYNEANKERVKTGYNETITMFFLRLTSMAIEADGAAAASSDFLDFLARHPMLDDFRFIFQFYSRERLYSAEARQQFVEPDLRPFPATLDDARRAMAP